MRIGMVGLGRMGGDLSRRLMAGGHEVVVNDLDAAAIADLADEGAIAAPSLGALAAALGGPRVVWIMVPAAVTGAVVDAVAAVLDEGDVIIDGGNSNWNDDLTRSAALAARGIAYVDIGTSGGVHGLERGYCLMVGGTDEAVALLTPILDTISPGPEAAPRTPGRTGAPVPAEKGWLHCGPSGAGHFVKMVHNGIEYGMMAAIAEGLNLLDHADLGREDREVDAETAPLRNPTAYRYEFDLGAIAEVWRRGSVIGSWLLDLTAGALARDPQLDAYEGHVSDSGEGRWTAQAAIDVGVPASVLTAAVHQRFASRGNDETAGKVLSAMRHAFGGHLEKSGGDD
ncbi:MAG: decarboxylating 6-phosphogluconate dehydrogenase [Acidimicrobiales bacterium]|nr:decarboxylating 6-phosphogluconate dehydrogenase [Acidimicrobiales bacterium]